MNNKDMLYIAKDWHRIFGMGPIWTINGNSDFAILTCNKGGFPLRALILDRDGDLEADNKDSPYVSQIRKYLASRRELEDVRGIINTLKCWEHFVDGPIDYVRIPKSYMPTLMKALSRYKVIVQEC